MSPAARALWCYVCVPCSGWCWWYSRDPLVRRQARQAARLGWWWGLALLLCSVLEAGAGYVHPWFGSAVRDLDVIVAVAGGLTWLWCVLHLARGREVTVPGLQRN